MDKGRAIKIGVAAVVLIIAAVLIFRSLSGGAAAGPPEGEERLGATPTDLLPLA